MDTKHIFAACNVTYARHPIEIPCRWQQILCLKEKKFVIFWFGVIENQLDICFYFVFVLTLCIVAYNFQYQYDIFPIFLFPLIVSFLVSYWPSVRFFPSADKHTMQLCNVLHLTSPRRKNIAWTLSFYPALPFSVTEIIRSVLRNECEQIELKVRRRRRRQ